MILTHLICIQCSIMCSIMCSILCSIQCSIQNLGITNVQGKYLAKDGGPKEARLNKYKGRYAEAESRYGLRPNVVAAIQAYVDLAKHAGISHTALALR